MKSLSSLEQLSEALRRLPGVGPKSALRMTYHLLQHDREGAEQIGKAMLNLSTWCITAALATRSRKMNCATPVLMRSVMSQCCA